MGEKRKIGQRIKLNREKKGFTQEQFAEMLNISTNYLSAIERGVKFPRFDNLIAIMNKLNVTADEIFMDVLNSGYKIKASDLEEKLEELSEEDRSRILSVLEVLIKEADKKE